jgi:crotonobetaine/carnitine-CoA ligase
MASTDRRTEHPSVSGESMAVQRESGSMLGSVVGDRTVAGVLQSGARRHPERALLVYDDGSGEHLTLSWAAMAKRTDAVAAELERRGIGAGDRIHVHLPNRPEFVLVWFAAARLGASIVPTNLASPAPEIAYVIEHSGACCSVTDADGRAVTEAAWDATGTRGQIVECEADGLMGLTDGEPVAAVPHNSAELGVLYTSGTTSRPKGVRITHANYVYVGEVVAGALRMRPDDRVLIVLPLFHANAQYYTTMSVLVTGATLILSRRFSASRFAEQAIAHGATLSSLFSAAVRMILAKEPAPHWRSTPLRAIIFGQNLSLGELSLWDDRLGIPLVQLYGMTETIGPPLINPLFGDARRTSIGRTTLGYRCRIVREDGTDVVVGEPGQLLVQGEPGVSLMAGYLDDEAATAAALRDGWLATGDIVRLDEDGLVTFVDRDKDLIKRAGENIAASEVESVLRDHPEVHDACVIGVPDAMRDEAIAAFVVLHAGAATTEDGIVAWCAERLASFRVPTSVEFVQELPRTAVGKIQKHVLKARWAERGVDA